MLSMTGYGRGEFDDGALKIVVEIKSVNNRYGEFAIKQPRNYLALEDKIKKCAANFIERGRVEIFIRSQDLTLKSRNTRINHERALAYHEELKKLCMNLKEGYHFDVYQLAALPEVIVEEEAQEDLENVWLVMEQALMTALKQHTMMRQQEGKVIAEDLLHKLAVLQSLHEAVSLRSPKVTAAYQERLQQRLGELLHDVAVDRERLAQEVAIFAEKSCIDEELVRLKSHFEQFAKIMTAKGSIGRKLDFLIQEMNRETNTIGSKANDLATSQLVVEMKSELEKIREQIQNIE